VGDAFIQCGTPIPKSISSESGLPTSTTETSDEDQDSSETSSIGLDILSLLFKVLLKRLK
jgi:hypothetical protein